MNWLLRQLKDAPPGLRLEAIAGNARSSTSELLGAVREDPGRLVNNPSHELRELRVAATSVLGTKRGAGRGTFIDSVLSAIDGFYSTVVQQIRPWAPRAPQLPKGSETVIDKTNIDVTPPTADLLEDEVLLGSAWPQGPETTDATTMSLAVESDGPDIAWDTAQERLDRERLYHYPSGEGADGSQRSPDRPDV